MIENKKLVPSFQKQTIRAQNGRVEVGLGADFQKLQEKKHGQKSGLTDNNCVITNNLIIKLLQILG